MQTFHDDKVIQLLNNFQGIEYSQHEAYNIPNYYETTKSGVLDFEEFYTIFKPYSNQNKFTDLIYQVKTENVANHIGNNHFQINSENQELLSNYTEYNKECLSLMNVIIRLKQKYPVIFKKFVNWDDFYFQNNKFHLSILDNNNKEEQYTKTLSLFNVNYFDLLMLKEKESEKSDNFYTYYLSKDKKHLFLEFFIKEFQSFYKFYNYLNANILQNANCITYKKLGNLSSWEKYTNKLLNAIKCTNLDETNINLRIVDYIDILSSLNVNERKEKDILKCLNASVNNRIYKEIDNLILSLLETQRGNENNNNILLKKLITGVDDETFFKGEDNYKALVLTLTKIITKSSTYITSFNNKFISNPESINFGFYDNGFFSRVGNIFTYEFGNETKCNWNTNNKIEAKNIVTYRGINLQNNIKPLVFSPLELISISNHSNLSLLNNIAGKDQTIIAPAIVLYYFNDKGTEAFNKAIATTVVDVVSIASGVGVLNLATKISYLRKASAIADILGGISSISVGALDECKNCPKIKTALSTLNILCAGVNISTLIKNPIKTDAIAEGLNATAISKMDISTAQKFVDELLLAGDEISKLPKNSIERLQILVVL